MYCKPIYCELTTSIIYLPTQVNWLFFNFTKITMIDFVRFICHYIVYVYKNKVYKLARINFHNLSVITVKYQ